MKKFLILFAAALTLGFSGCSDVPEPYGINGGEGVTTGLNYTSTNLSTGWTLQTTSEQPWSQGSSYVQATGYQKWDGADAKSNKEVEGCLISPSFNTSGSEKVKYSFDYTIRYTNNVTDWEKNHKILASKDYVGGDFATGTWYELPFTPVASPYSDWTLYSSGEMQLPEEFVNQQNVHIAFYFYAPATGSTTWEIKNFKISDGEAQAGGDDPVTPVEGNGTGTKDDPYDVATALAIIDAKAYTASEVYVKGKISQIDEVDETGQFGNATYYISDDGTTAGQLEVFRGYFLGGEKFTSASQIKVGDEVIVYGKLTFYDKTSTPEIGTGSKIYSLNGTVKDVEGGGGTEPDPTIVGDPKGSGTPADPFNVAAAQKKIADRTFTKDKVYVKGKISKIDEVDETGKFGNATYYISDDGTAAGQLEVFRGYFQGGAKFTSASQIKVGDEVIVYGELTYYEKTSTPEITTGSQIYSLNGNVVEIDSKREDGGGGGGEGGDDTPGGGTATGTDGNTLDITKMGYTDKQDFNGVTVNVGDANITFNKATGGSKPMYYENATAIRLYAGNTLTISSSKTIKAVKFTYAPNAGSTSYCPTESTGKVEPGTYDVATHTWTLNANEGVLTHEAKTGHFRIQSITIEY